MSLGAALTKYAALAIPRYDDGGPVDRVADRTLAACPKEQTALRGGIVQTVARHAPPSDPEAQKMIDASFARIMSAAHKVMADEVTRQRSLR